MLPALPNLCLLLVWCPLLLTLWIPTVIINTHAPCLRSNVNTSISQVPTPEFGHSACAWEPVRSKPCNCMGTKVDIGELPVCTLITVHCFASEQYRAKIYRVTYWAGPPVWWVIHFCKLQGQVIIIFIVRSWFFNIFPARSWNFNTSLARSCQQDVENSRPYLEDDEIWSPYRALSVWAHHFVHVPVPRHWCLGSKCEHIFRHQYTCLCETYWNLLAFDNRSTIGRSSSIEGEFICS